MRLAKKVAIFGEFVEASIPSGFCYSAGADTTGAGPYGLVGLPDNHVDPLKVWIPSPVRQVMGVADSMTIHRPFITDLTACHDGGLPSI